LERLIFGGKGKGWISKMEIEKRIFCSRLLSLDPGSLTDFILNLFLGSVQHFLFHSSGKVMNVLLLIIIPLITSNLKPMTDLTRKS